MYCDFNVKLFKEFTSMKTKVKPALSDDWEIIPDAHVTNDGFKMRSEKLNQTVADIGLRRFLQFSKEQNLTIEGLKLKGTFIIGNDRSVYTEEMYNKWKNKFESRTETIIPKKDWIPGHRYRTPCGAVVHYIGAKYISRLKNSEFRKGIYVASKITKKHFVVGNYSVLEENKMKFSEDLGASKIPENIWRDFQDDNPTIVYLGDKNIKNPVFDLEPVWDQSGKKCYARYRSSDNKYRSDSFIVRRESGIYTFNDYVRKCVMNDDRKITIKDGQITSEKMNVGCSRWSNDYMRFESSHIDEVQEFLKLILKEAKDTNE